MKFCKKIIKLMLVGVTLTGFATAQTDSSWSVGHGYLSGGVVGAQYQIVQEEHKWTAAAGLIGLSVGWQMAVDDAKRHSLGLATGVESFTAESGFLVATYQFYPAGFAEAGMRWGFSAGVRREDNGGWWSESGKNKNEAAIALEIGYQF